MDAPDLPPLPPLPLGDPGGTPADADALRGILRRHRRRQFATGALALAVMLAAGGAAGFAVGHGSAPASHGVQVAAGTPTQAAAAGPHSEAGPSIGVSSGVDTASPGVPGPIGPKFTQLLLRDASDGTRVRLYEQEVTIPKVACPSGSECPQVMVPPCAPTSFVTAEVSNDQVAGQTGGAVWSTSPSAPLEVVSLGVVGAGQPEPILVVVGRVQSSVAKVTLTTPYGTDVQAPTGGWVALAVGLPADFSKSGTGGLRTSTLVASDSSGKALSSQPVSQTAHGPGPACRPGCAALGTGPKGVAPGNASGSGGAAAPAGAPAPAGGPGKGLIVDGCPFPCPATNSTAKGGVPNIAVCVAPPRPATSPPVLPPPGSPNGTTGSSATGSGSGTTGNSATGSSTTALAPTTTTP
jgi:hypothetical protein